MPKLKSKQKAIAIILNLGREFTKLCEERGVDELTVGRGELKHMFNTGVRRGKDVITMALQRFVVNERIITQSWEIEVKDWDKPVLRFRRIRE